MIFWQYYRNLHIFQNLYTRKCLLFHSDTIVGTQNNPKKNRKTDALIDIGFGFGFKDISIKVSVWFTASTFPKCPGSRTGSFRYPYPKPLVSVFCIVRNVNVSITPQLQITMFYEDSALSVPIHRQHRTEDIDEFVQFTRRGTAAGYEQ